MNLIFLGPPGAGKGTQAKIVVDRLQSVQISTGDILRAAVKEKTELGLKAQEYMDRGDLVPDEIVIGIIKERIKAPDCANGFILDGFPRTIEQAKALDELLKKSNMKIDHVINFEVNDEELIARLLSRAKAEGRSDDNPESIRNRLKVFNEKTQPLIDYYRSVQVLRNVYGLGEIQEIANKVKSLIGS